MKLSETKRDRNKVFITEFTGLTEFNKHCDLTPANKKIWKDMNQQSSIGGSKDFTLTNSFKEANELMRNGWSKGAEELNKKLKLANATAQNKEVKKAIYDIVGFQASVPRYLQGIPTSMINKRNVKQKVRVVTLMKSIAYHAGINASEIMQDSIKFLQIVQEIEKQGIRVNVEVCWHSIHDNEEVFMRIRIKSASERLNVSKMSYPLLHPSFLRRHAFRSLECEQRTSNTGWRHGYGRPGKAEETKALLTGNEYFIPVLITDKEAHSILDKIK